MSNHFLLRLPNFVSLSAPTHSRTPPPPPSTPLFGGRWGGHFCSSSSSVVLVVFCCWLVGFLLWVFSVGVCVGGEGGGACSSSCCLLGGEGVLLFCVCFFSSFFFLLPGSPFRLSALSQSRGDNPDGGCRPLLRLFPSFQCGGQLLAPPMD